MFIFDSVNESNVTPTGGCQGYVLTLFYLMMAVAEVGKVSITRYYGKLRLLTRDQSTDPSLNSLFTETNL